MYRQMMDFLMWLEERNTSRHTLKHWELYLRYFVSWCDERGLTRPAEITRPILERYQRHLFLKRKKNGAPLSATTQASRITPIRKWFRWLTRNNRVLYNPAADLDLPKVEERLPKHVLTIEEVERVLNLPDTTTALGVRDRAMLETLYSTGIRRMEIIGLQQRDVDYDRGTLMVRQGKGKKDRMIPIGDRALAWVGRYRDEVRPELAIAGDDGTLFLTVTGQAFSDNRMTQMVRNHVRAAGLGNIGSCHLFRHAMATQMLENGADVRFIQAMLGHADIKTTQVYTRVSIRALKDIHSATHPARLERSGSRGKDAIEERKVTASDLLAALDAEADEEPVP
ncbi:MAG: site-specific tyrosine recombinase XerC [Burkholderiales bacterium]|nr:site-specific tyrosine recombinase XerC [Burkholderiales bacterium]